MQKKGCPGLGNRDENFQKGSEKQCRAEDLFLPTLGRKLDRKINAGSRTAPE